MDTADPSALRWAVFALVDAQRDLFIAVQDAREAGAAEATPAVEFAAGTLAERELTLRAMAKAYLQAEPRGFSTILYRIDPLDRDLEGCLCNLYRGGMQVTPYFVASLGQVLPQPPPPMQIEWRVTP